MKKEELQQEPAPRPTSQGAGGNGEGGGAGVHARRACWFNRKATICIQMVDNTNYQKLS